MAKKKKISRASKRRLFVFGNLSLLIIGYFLFSAGFYVYKIYTLKNEEKVLKENLKQLQKEEKNLSTDMEKLKDPDYLAKYARETYSYSKDKEVIIQTHKKKNKEDKKETFTINDKHILIGCGCIMGLVMIYIIKKNKKNKR